MRRDELLTKLLTKKFGSKAARLAYGMMDLTVEKAGVGNGNDKVSKKKNRHCAC